MRATNAVGEGPASNTAPATPRPRPDTRFTVAGVHDDDAGAHFLTATTSDRTASLTTPTEGAQYHWTIENGTFVGAADGTGVTFRAATVGTLKLSVTGTNASGESTRSLDVQLVAPAETPVIVAPDRLTTTASAFASVTAVAGQTYRWTIAGGVFPEPGGESDTSTGELLGSLNQVLFRAATSGGVVTLTCTAVNAAGDAAPAAEHALEILPRVEVASVTPAGAGALPEAPLVVTFTRAIDPATLTVNDATDACTGTVTLRAAGAPACVRLGHVEGSVDATSFTLTPADALDFATSYTLHVGEVTDTDGVAVTRSTEGYAFTTKPRPPAVHHLGLTGVVAAVSVGQDLTPTVSALDASGQIVAGYAGTVRITASTDPRAALPEAYTFTARDGGVHVFGGLRLRTTGVHTIIATDTTHGEVTGTLTTTVQPGPPARLTFTRQPSTASVRTAFVPDVVVAVTDVEGNVVPTASGSLTLSLAANPGAATLAGSTSQALSRGVATFEGLSLNNEGAATLLATWSGGLSQQGTPIAVTDELAPARPDLTATTLGPDTIALAWSAPGDDGLLGELAPTTGPRGSYEVCVTPQGGAATCHPTGDPGVPVPARPGSAEAVQITQLTPATPYAFSVRALDGAGNASTAFASSTTDALPSGPLSTAPGDTCALAPTLTGASVEIESTTVGLANDYSTGPSTCASTGGPDGVYKVDVPPGRRLTATITGAGTFTFDPSIAIGLAPEACTNTGRSCLAGSDSGSAATRNTVVHDNTSTTTRTVHLFVDSGSTTPGPFLLTTAVTAIPAGDSCASAVTLPATGTHPGSLSEAYLDDFSTAGANLTTNCGQYLGADRVYRVEVPPGQRLSATVTGTAPFDPALTLGFESAACVNTTARACLGTSNLAGTATDTVTYTNRNGTPQTVVLFVDAAGATPTGDFTITTALDAAPPETPGESCFSAIPVTTTGAVPTIVSGTTVGFANDSGGGTGCLSPATPTATSGRDRVYTVTLLPGQRVKAVVTPQSTFNVVLELVAGPPSQCEPRPRTCSATASAAGSGGVEQLSYTNTTPDALGVFIVVDSTITTVAAQSGTFELAVTVDTP